MIVEQRPVGSLLLHSIVGGIVAGVVFIVAEMVMALVMGGALVDPLRLIGTIVFGAEARSPTYPLATAVISGAIVHLVLSAIYGVIFVYLLVALGQRHASAPLLLLYGSLFGFALWIVNFLIIAPIFWPQFTTVDQFWNGFVAYTFFYGTVIGGYAASVRPGAAATLVR